MADPGDEVAHGTAALKLTYQQELTEAVSEELWGCVQA